jgi:twitching motility protein PilT
MEDQEKKVMINRRQFERVRAQLAIEYRIIDEDKSSRAWNTTVTKNISAAGICFESFHPLGLNVNIEVSLRVPFFQTPIVMKAKVVRVAEIKAGEIYGVAAAITDIKQTDRKKLQIELEQIDITMLLQQTAEQQASDLHLSLGHPPTIRKADKLVQMKYDALGKKAIKRMVFSLLSEQEIEYFNENLEVSTAITLVTITGTFRFRLNAFLQQDIVEAVFHFIRIPVPSLDELNIPEVVGMLTNKKSGLLVITGSAGCGKTTTCAALIDMINTQSTKVITMLMHPVEYVFEPKKSIIRQRLVGGDVKSYAQGVVQAQKQNSDIIVLDQIPDVEAMDQVIKASQCGTLVIVTMKSPGIIEVLNQIIYSFDSDKQYYVRKVLSECLVGVIYQKLLPKKDKTESLIAAAEVLINTGEAAEAIREGFFNKIPAIITNDVQHNMQSMEKAVQDLWDQGLIDNNTAKQTR